MINKLNNNKKGVELSLQTIVVFIILLIVFIMVIYFFVTHYGNNSDTLLNLSSGAIADAKNN